jgi:hypothetical protein
MLAGVRRLGEASYRPPVRRAFPIHTDIFQYASVHFEAQECGHAAINGCPYEDVYDKGARSLPVKTVYYVSQWQREGERRSPNDGACDNCKDECLYRPYKTAGEFFPRGLKSEKQQTDSQTVDWLHCVGRNPLPTRRILCASSCATRARTQAAII